MSNIENLTQKIELDAKKKADSIVEDAKKDAEVIVNSSRSKAEKEASEIVKKASNEADSIVEKALSSAELSARDRVLSAKEEVVERVFSLANERLKNLDTKDYIDYLKKSLNDLSDLKDAVLTVPEKYYDSVKKEFPDIKVSDNAFVESGFNVKKGNILYNNDFSSIIEAKRSDLEYEVAMKLFG